MRTLIQGGWVVGYDGRGHELIPNGSVVFEDDRVIHVGRDFDGTVDHTIDATGKLVSPGFINFNLAIGTDTYPQDMIHEMRWAALMSRMADQSFTVGKPRDVFDAATLGGARHLGRDDIGRLAVGAKADIIVVDLLQVHYGAVHDPIQALVECGSGSDVETIVVDGQILVANGKAARFDEAQMLREVQAEGERIWQSVPEWHWTGKGVDEIVPPSYPVRG